MKDKIFAAFREAVSDIPDGASVMMTMFGGPAGVPQNLILALRDHGAKGLVVIACPNFGFSGGVRVKPGFKPYITPNILVENNQVKKGIVTWGRGEPGSPSAFEEAVLSGRVEGEIIPLGVFAHRLRAGGSGIGAFYSPIGIGTVYEKGKEKRAINGRDYIMEYPLRADFGFVRAYKADRLGNLVYKGTGRSFNPLIAKACHVTIAEVDDIVEIGELDPEHIVTPGIYIDRIARIPEGGWK